MAYIVVSQHTYKDEKKLYVIMASSASSFSNVTSDIQDYINKYNSDNADFTAFYSAIDTLNVSNFHAFSAKQAPTLVEVDDAYRGGFYINFIVRLTPK